MTAYKRTISVMGFLFLFSANVAYADDKPSAEFFASNNTKEINIQTAYSRLTGLEQSQLQNSMIAILQKKSDRPRNI